MQNKNCKFAPPGHERHQIFSRDYSMTEMRMMIQYLVYYDEIANGRGYKVWKDMIERGYMLHRTYQSLQNNFRKVILRDIKLFKLSKKLEEKFLSLCI